MFPMLLGPLASVLAPVASSLAPAAGLLQPIAKPVVRLLLPLVFRPRSSEVWWPVEVPQPKPDPEPEPEYTPSRYPCSFCSNRVFWSQLREAPVTPELPWTVFEGRVCDGCWEKEAGPYEAAYRHALVKADDVETWSITYQGIIPVDARGQRLTSEWSRSKTACVRQLKVAAAFLGFDALIEVDREHERPACDGNYKYRMFQATARTARRLGKR